MLIKPSQPRIKVLFVVEQCNPEWSSVPGVAYNFYQELRHQVEITLVTHERNRPALEKHHDQDRIVYISQSATLSGYSSWVHQIAAGQGKFNWPLYHTLLFPIYAEFNHQVYQRFKDAVANGEYDIVHALTPMIPRYPVKLIRACSHTPFLLGPVNGGIPFPPGFQKVAWQEKSYLNFFRILGRWLIPGYRETYKKADRILAGSTYTLQLLEKLFGISQNRLSLFSENGIPASCLHPSLPKPHSDQVNLLFMGRLVPYKCADLVIEAIERLHPSIKQKVQLTIVGKGSEEGRLKQKVTDLQLENQVTFVGWVPQKNTWNYYNRADIFCFPSIREFGGAVVLEAMACGLPCIVANHGGIGEYVTAETGFKIEPISREYLIQELANKIEILVKNPELRDQMSAKAIDRAREFVWENKARQIVKLYEEMLCKQPHLSHSIPPLPDLKLPLKFGKHLS